MEVPQWVRSLLVLPNVRLLGLNPYSNGSTTMGAF